VADSSATAFTIDILEGDLAGTQIALVGTMLPFKGVSFATKQRVKTTYYPGNPVASQQVFGATKENTTVSGVWYDGALGDGNARALVRQIEFLVERGTPVEVQWGSGVAGTEIDVGVVRRGIIKSIDPKYDLTEIIPWTIEFEWRGEDLQTKPPTFAAGVSGQQSPAEEFSALSDLLTGTLATLSSWRHSAFRILGAGTGAILTVNNALDDAQSAFSNAISVFDTAAAVADDVAQLPSNVVDRVRGACDRVVSSAQNVRAAIDDVCGLQPLVGGLKGQDWIDAAEFVSLEAKTVKQALFPTDDPLDQLDGMSQQYDLISALDTMAESAAIESAALSAKQTPIVIAEVRPPAGSDLRDLALQYYGNADLWVLIADFNDLDSSEVPTTPTGPSDLGAPPILIPDQTAYAVMLAQLWGAPQVDQSQGGG
jgi:phage protein U